MSLSGWSGYFLCSLVRSLQLCQLVDQETVEDGRLSETGRAQARPGAKSGPGLARATRLWDKGRPHQGRGPHGLGPTGPGGHGEGAVSLWCPAEVAAAVRGRTNPGGRARVHASD